MFRATQSDLLFFSQPGKILGCLRERKVRSFSLNCSQTTKKCCLWMNLGKAKNSYRRKLLWPWKKRCEQNPTFQMLAYFPLPLEWVRMPVIDSKGRKLCQHLHRNAIFRIFQYVGPKFWPFCSLCNGVTSKERENWLLYRCGNFH